MNPEPHLSLIARTIQLSVAPVFLLTAIGTTLAILIGRLNRIVDRARILEGLLPSATAKDEGEIHAELSALSQRAKLINLAVTMGTVCAVLICAMISLMFIGVFLSIDLADMVAALFVSATFVFIGALLTFLREIFIAVKNLRIGLQ